ncbi:MULTISPECIES: molybdopterin molybdotransferase MoeA [unclassified Streptosporangium]|uniref:molybdopterin molybdotransferase MoeA n=1 Tax=unclassified Streptosporangium TaxID=2632669 RepID=UPI002E2BD626|nr:MULTISPECIES: molybdopterin-binding protein [unclassified Streptosporangium]
MAVLRSTVHEAPSRDPAALSSPGPSPAPSPAGAPHRGAHAEALPWESARRVAASAAGPLSPVDLPLHLAYGCRLAGPLRALVPVPGADVAAMDGYAVAGDPPWRITGLVLAGGAAYGAALAPGTAVEIATGAPVPEGAEAVLPYEAAVRTGAPPPGGGVPGRSAPPGRFTPPLGRFAPPGGESRTAGGPVGEWVSAPSGAVEPGRHIRRRGEDCPLGTVVLTAGSAVTPAVLGLAAGLGHDVLRVRPKPLVSVLVTGDEVVTLGLPGPGRVRDAIGPMLPGLVEWAGGRAEAPSWLPDGARALTAALAGTQDGPPGQVIVVCGASSKGPADHLRAVLAGLGAEILVDGVAVRPGHPQLLARLPDGRLVAGLPGNPYAALVAALTLLAPAVRALAGGPEAPRERSALTGHVRPHHADTRMVAVRRGGRGAVPVGHDRPGSLWGAALAEALAVVPPGWRGEPVELVSLPAQRV